MNARKEAGPGRMTCELLKVYEEERVKRLAKWQMRCWKEKKDAQELEKELFDTNLKRKG